MFTRVCHFLYVNNYIDFSRFKQIGLVIHFFFIPKQFCSHSKEPGKKKRIQKDRNMVLMPKASKKYTNKHMLNKFLFLITQVLLSTLTLVCNYFLTNHYCTHVSTWRARLKVSSINPLRTSSLKRKMYAKYTNKY